MAHMAEVPPKVYSEQTLQETNPRIQAATLDGPSRRTSAAMEASTGMSHTLTSCSKHNLMVILAIPNCTTTMITLLPGSNSPYQMKPSP